MSYAFDELRGLASRMGSEISDRDLVVRYACALVAELAYHHVPAFEIDDQKRAIVIPCEGFRAIVARGVPTDVLAYLQQRDFKNVFVVVERGIVAVGIVLNRLLFVGFRGTIFLFDWKINLTAPLAQIGAGFNGRSSIRLLSGRAHQGFAEEAVRISARLMDEIRNLKEDIDHVFLAGHSLGGAVAALSERFLGIRAVSTCMFGSPRYCDISWYYTSSEGPPTQVQRPGDIVPYIPPRRLGYADHPYQFNTDGGSVIDPHSPDEYEL